MTGGLGLLLLLTITALGIWWSFKTEKSLVREHQAETNNLEGQNV